MDDRTRTGSVDTTADPGPVIGLLADAVRPAVNPDAGTVDYLREMAPGREGPR